jgi:hypothetical protein
MTENTSFNRGFLSGILLMLGAEAVHWFIGVGTPEAGALRVTAVVAQAAIGLGGGAWLYVRQRSLSSVKAGQAG